LLPAMRAWVAVPASKLGRVLIGYLQDLHNPILLAELLIRYNLDWSSLKIFHFQNVRR
jgi:hypothetical protein